jgi:integrase
LRELRKKILIPAFTLTEVCAADDPLASERSVKDANCDEDFVYYLRPVVDPIDGVPCNYNLLPVVIDQNSVPWDLGTLFILGRLETQSSADMVTVKSLAVDLGAFKEWLDSHEDPEDLLVCFPKMKLRRVTYRYKGALKKKIEVGEIASSTAKRRMGTVISFYRWMIEENFIEPANDPWEERTYNLSLKNSYGHVFKKVVTTTDLRIASPRSDDPFAGTIQDGGELRPLPTNEQEWVMEAAEALGNGEMYLIILFMILTGARIQTVCTLRMRHFSQKSVSFSKALSGTQQVYKLRAGPGTGIDTKYDKTGVLQIPRSFYEALHNYAHSDRARRRRRLAPGGEHEDQYLFLTQQGSPYYTTKEEARRFDPAFTRRHQKNGGTIRQFFKDYLIPYVQKTHSQAFKFRPHDLRATFGMNQTDAQMALVQAGEITLNKARTNVMSLMWHTSSKTTDLYIDYRKQMETIYAAVNGYGVRVQEWIDRSMKGVDD